MKINNRNFDFVSVEDSDRNGIVLECRETVEGTKTELLMEAFLDDSTGEITFWGKEGELPFDLLVAFIEMAIKMSSATQFMS